MKGLFLAFGLALTTTVYASPHSFSVADEVIESNKVNRNILLTAYGVIDYYRINCAGLTDRGKKLTLKTLYESDLYLLKDSELTNTEAFKFGYKQASKLTCNNLRRELFKAGARSLFR